MQDMSVESLISCELCKLEGNLFYYKVPYSQGALEHLLLK